MKFTHVVLNKKGIMSPFPIITINYQPNLDDFINSHSHRYIGPDIPNDGSLLDANDFELVSYDGKTAWIPSGKTIKPIEDQITQDILAELTRAEAKHSWEKNTLELSTLIFSEEAGEVSRAVVRHIQEGHPISDIREELIQTGAMVYRMIKNLPE